MQEKGQSLIEVLIVLAVTVVIVVAMTMAVLMSLKNAQFAQNQLKATRYAQEAMEKIRAIRDRDQEGDIFFSYSVIEGDPTIRQFSGLWGVSMSTRCAPICYFTFEGEVLTSGSEVEVESLENGLVTRQITLEDESATFATEKKVGVKVKWKDSAGEHESNLQTIITSLSCQASDDPCNVNADCCSNSCSSGVCQ